MKFNKGDIIVSLVDVLPYRDTGSIFKVKKQVNGAVYYLEDTSGMEIGFRLATSLEITAYNQGVRNINDIKQCMNYYFY